jgi:hypothetical protein
MALKCSGAFKSLNSDQTTSWGRKLGTHAAELPERATFSHPGLSRGILPVSHLWRLTRSLRWKVQPTTRSMQTTATSTRSKPGAGTAAR